MYFRAPVGCERRIRTSTGRLAAAQRLVVNPGRPYTRYSRLYAVFIPATPTPETRGHGCLFHHLTLLEIEKVRS